VVLPGRGAYSVDAPVSQQAAAAGGH